MPDVGFLARYNEQVTLDLGDGYWLKFRRHLSREDFAAANDKLFSPIVRIVAAEDGSTDDAHSETSGALNTSAQQDEYVARALLDWNLTDENNQPIPLGTVRPGTGPDAARYAAVRLLPEVDVFDKVLAGIEGVRRQRSEARKEQADADRFPGTAGAGAQAPKARSR